MRLFPLYRPYVGFVLLLLLAVVVLFPRPGVTVQPALPGASVAELDRIAELQSKALAAPHDRAIALELGSLYIDQGRADWALATLGPFDAEGGNDFAVRLTMAIAFAERYDFAEANRQLERAEQACDQDPRCSPSDRVRIEFLGSALHEVVSAGASYAKNPNQVRQILDQALHNVKIPRGAARAIAPRKSAPAAPFESLGSVRSCTQCHPSLFPK